MVNRVKCLLVSAAVPLLLLTAACQGEAGSSLRLPTAVPPTVAAPPSAGGTSGQAAPPAVPKAGINPQAPVGGGAVPPGMPPAPTLPPQVRVTSTAPTPTPLPTTLVVTGSGDTALRRPVSLAFDKSGGLYIGDQLGIHQYDAAGKYVKTLIKSGPDTGLRVATGIDVAPNGDLLVADSVANSVFRLKPDGQLAGKLEPTEVKFDAPISVEFDPQGNLFVVNQGSAEVFKFDPNGKLLLKFGSKGEQNGQFLRPRGIALDKDGNIYVTDLTTYLIQKFGPDGKYLKSFGNQRYGENGWFLRGMAVGPDERLYVVDGAQQRIQVFDLSNLTMIKEFQNPGRDPGQFQDPEDLRIDTQGNIYLADKGNNRVQKLKLTL